MTFKPDSMPEVPAISPEDIQADVKEVDENLARIQLERGVKLTAQEERDVKRNLGEYIIDLPKDEQEKAIDNALENARLDKERKLKELLGEGEEKPQMPSLEDLQARQEAMKATIKAGQTKRESDLAQAQSMTEQLQNQESSHDDEPADIEKRDKMDNAIFEIKQFLGKAKDDESLLVYKQMIDDDFRRQCEDLSEYFSDNPNYIKNDVGLPDLLVRTLSKSENPSFFDKAKARTLLALAL